MNSKHHAAIIFGVLLDNADEDWLGRNQLMLALTAYTKVVLLEKPRYSGQLVEVLKPSIEEVRPNLFIMRNAMALRFQRVGKRIASVSSLIDGAWFHDCLKQAGITDYVYWLTVADPKLALNIPRKRWVYDCMDPCFLPELQSQFDAAEAFLAGNSRVVFCTAHVLYEKMKPLNSQTFLLQNATSEDTIQSLSQKHDLPELLHGRRGPFVGYMGTLDWRFDSSYVYEAARLLPDYTFVMVGRVNGDQRENARRLESLANVVITGQVSYEDGHRYNKAFDVGLIPFKPSPMNDAINSVKMFMYLATGKPVVATSIEECRRNHFVTTAESPADFARAIQTSVREDNPELRKQRSEFALGNTWGHRAETAVCHLRNAGFSL